MKKLIIATIVIVVSLCVVLPLATGFLQAAREEQTSWDRYVAAALTNG